MPSGLYLADGLVINSILLIEDDGICLSNCSAGILDNLPSTITLTFWLPRKLIDPVCWSTLTDGRLFIISLAVAPAVCKSLPIVMTFRSTFCCIVEVSATIVTSSKLVAASSKFIVPKSIILLSLLITIVLF